MSIRAFVSYSRKDASAVEQLVTDLERGHTAVWHDAELHGGEAWWSQILDEIRACDVFVFAVSNDGLASKPCRAELQYARDLGVPVLPVQVGAVESFRTAPIGQIQVVDYRAQNPATGITLLTALADAAGRKQAPPDPLPAPPPVPFEYLLRLGAAIEAEQLTPTEQGGLISQLRECLETEDDPSVRVDAFELLRALHHRTDVTLRNAGEIDQLLALAAAGAGTGGGAREAPRTGGQGSVHPGPHPPPPQDSRTAPGSGPSSGPSSRPSSGPAEGAPGRVGPQPGGPGYPPPGWVPPGPPAGTGPPAPSRTGSRAPLLVIAAVVVALVGIGGYVVVKQASSNGGSTPTDFTDTSSTDSFSTSSTASSPPPSPQDDLLSVIPGDFDAGNCATSAPSGDGDLAAVSCGPSSTQAGPSTSVFHLYPAGTVDNVFVKRMNALPLAAYVQGASCPGYQGYGNYTRSGVPKGRLACWTGQNGASYLMWTENDFDTVAVVSIPSGGSQGVAVLYEWWRSHSEVP